MFLDFREMYESGIAFWAGEYVGLYPYPANAVFALFALLPFNISLIIWTMVAALALLDTFGRRATYWVLYAPIAFTFCSGQTDLFFLWLMKLGTGPALALMLFKPQLLLFAVPEMLKMDRRDFVKFVAVVVIVFGLPTILRPSWPFEWVERVLEAHETQQRMVTLIGYPLLAAVFVVARHDWKNVWTVANPRCLYVYDLTMLAGRSLWLVPASWVLFAVSAVIGNSFVMAFLGVFYSRMGEEDELSTRLDQ